MPDYESFDLTLKDTGKVVSVVHKESIPFSFAELQTVFTELPAGCHLEINTSADILQEMDIQQLLQSLVTGAHRFRLTITQPVMGDKYNLLLHAYYAYSCRQQRCLLVEPLDIGHLLSKKPGQGKLRLAKRQLLEGASIKPKVHHQVHHQKHAQETRAEEQQVAQDKAQFQVREQQIAEQKARAVDVQQHAHQTVDLASFGKLIHRGNLQELLCDDWTLKDLEEVWDRLVGEHAAFVEDPGYRISHVPAATFLQILAHKEQFSGGVCLHNLPNGFGFVVTQAPVHAILYHRKESEKESDVREDTFLAPQCLVQAHGPWEMGNVGQFYPFSSFDSLLSFETFCHTHQANFAAVFNDSIDIAIRLDALVALMILDKPTLEGECTALQSLFATCSPQTLRVLRMILLQQGTDTVLQLYVKLQVLAQDETFQKAFLSHPDDWQNFLPRAITRPDELSLLSALEYLANMPPIERLWWHALLAQHSAHNAKCDIVDLVNAHAYFFKRLKALNPALELPMVCPVKGIKNLKTTYDRLLFILEHAINPAEQMLYLEELDWGPQGAILAAQQGFYLLTSAMQLTPSHTLLDLQKYKHILEATHPNPADKIWKTATATSSIHSIALDLEAVDFDSHNMIYGPCYVYNPSLLDAWSLGWTTNPCKLFFTLTKDKDNYPILVRWINYRGEVKMYPYIVHIPILHPTLLEAVSTHTDRLDYLTPYAKLVHLSSTRPSFQGGIPFFYRCLATEPYTLAFTSYQDMISRVVSFQSSIQDIEELKQRTLPLLALTTTGSRALKQKQDIAQDVIGLLTCLESLSPKQDVRLPIIHIVYHSPAVQKYFETYAMHVGPTGLAYLKKDLSVGDLIVVTKEPYSQRGASDDWIYEVKNDKLVLLPQSKLSRIKDTIFNIQYLEGFEGYYRFHIVDTTILIGGPRLVGKTHFAASTLMTTTYQLLGTRYISKTYPEALALCRQDLFTLLGNAGYTHAHARNTMPYLLQTLNEHLIGVSVRPLLREATAILRLQPTQEVLAAVFERVQVQGENVYLSIVAFSVQKPPQDSVLKFLTFFKDIALTSLQKNVLLLLSSFLPYASWETLAPLVASVHQLSNIEHLETLLALLKTTRLRATDAYLSLEELGAFFAAFQQMPTIHAPTAPPVDACIEDCVREHLPKLHVNDKGLSASLASILLKIQPLIANLESILGEEGSEEFDEAALIKQIMGNLRTKVRALATQLRGLQQGSVQAKDLLRSMQALVDNLLDPFQDVPVPKDDIAAHLAMKVAVTIMISAIKPMLLSTLSKLFIDSLQAGIAQQLIALNISDSLLDKDTELGIKLSTAVDSFLKKTLPNLTNLEHLAVFMNRALQQKDSIDTFLTSLQNFRPQTSRDLLLVQLYREGYLSSRALPYTLDELAQLLTIIKTRPYNPSHIITALFQAKEAGVSVEVMVSLLTCLMEEITLDESMCLSLLDIGLAHAHGRNVVRALLLLKKCLSTDTFMALHEQSVQDKTTLPLAPLDALARLTHSKAPHMDAFVRHLLLDKPFLATIGLDRLVHTLEGAFARHDTLPFVVLSGACWNRLQEGLISYVEMADLVEKLATLTPIVQSSLELLYAQRPCPRFVALKQALSKDDDADIMRFIEASERDPFGRRESIVAQYSLEGIAPYIASLTRLPDKSALTPAEQTTLLHAYAYIIGVSRTFGRPGLDGRLKPFCDRSHSELLNDYRVATSRPLESSAKLDALAIFCEVWFRTSGKFPYFSQILSVLASICFPGNIALEIPTGQGKSDINILLAALHFSFPPTQGTWVGVFSSNGLLIERDYKAGIDFFQYLSIQPHLLTAAATASSSQHLFQTPVIFFSTLADWSLYASALKMVHRVSLPARERILGVFDECDRVLYDSGDTDYNFSTSEEDPYVNPLEWVYALVNEFIKEPSFLTPTLLDYQDVLLLRTYLKARAPQLYQKGLVRLTDFRLSMLINAACTAALLVEDRDFIIGSTKRIKHGQAQCVSKAIILDNHMANAEATLSDGVQQCLHERLSRQYAQRIKDKLIPPFPIDNEIPCVDSHTASSRLADIGVFIGTTGTLGSTSELQESRAHYRLNTCLAFPPRRKKQLTVLPTQFTDENRFFFGKPTQLQAVLSTLKQHRKQPVLLVAEDIVAAEYFFAAIHALYPEHVQIIHAKLAENTSEFTRAIQKAGQSSMISIATPLAGRGVDIQFTQQLTHSLGHTLLVILTFVERDRNERQILGRTARGDKPGQVLGIYDLSALLRRFYGDKIHTLSRRDKLQFLKKESERLDAEAAIVRVTQVRLKAIRQPVEKLFDDMLLQTLPGSDACQAILIQKQDFLCFARTHWETLLSESVSDAQWQAPYLRYNAQGELQADALDDLIGQYSQDIKRHIDMLPKPPEVSKPTTQIDTLEFLSALFALPVTANPHEAPISEDAAAEAVVVSHKPTTAAHTFFSAAAATTATHPSCTLPTMGTPANEQLVTSFLLYTEEASDNPYQKTLQVEAEFAPALRRWIDSPKNSTALRLFAHSITQKRLESMRQEPECHIIVQLKEIQRTITATTSLETLSQYLDFVALAYQDISHAINPAALQEASQALTRHILTILQSRANKKDKENLAQLNIASPLLMHHKFNSKRIQHVITSLSHCLRTLETLSSTRQAPVEHGMLTKLDGILDKLKIRASNAGLWKNKPQYQKKVATLSAYRDQLRARFQLKDVECETYGMKLRAKYDSSLFQTTSKFFLFFSPVTTTRQLKKLATAFTPKEFSRRIVKG